MEIEKTLKKPGSQVGLMIGYLLLLFALAIVGNALLMVVHLFRVDPEQVEVRDISGKMNFVEDRFPAWSSEGDWLAFSRKMTGVRMGLQLGMMRSDGTEAFPLTMTAAYTHTLPVWSPDDRYLVFQRSPVEDFTTPPEIWLLDVSNGQSQQVVSSGIQSTWLP